MNDRVIIKTDTAAMVGSISTQSPPRFVWQEPGARSLKKGYDQVIERTQEGQEGRG